MARFQPMVSQKDVRLEIGMPSVDVALQPLRAESRFAEMACTKHREPYVTCAKIRLHDHHSYKVLVIVALLKVL